MNLKLLSKLFGAIIIMTLGSPLGAAVIYDESISGDLDSGSPLDLGVLNSGSNFVIGSSGFEYNFGPANDLDTFGFSVRRGSALTGVRLSVALRPIGSGELSVLGWQLQGRGGLFADNYSDVPDDNHPLFGDVLLLGGGQYTLSNYIAGSLGPGQFRVADYRLDLEVAPVPLPAGIWLSVAAAAALAAARFSDRRKSG